MSESQQSRVVVFDNSAPDMQRAYATARATFRYFWREVARDQRRIVPALGLACVKAPFSDGDSRADTRDTPGVEHMWLSEVDFDGECVSGTLANDPNWLKSVKAGDRARFPLDQISDWMCAISDDVYGAFTVNLLRSRMDPNERRAHDEAWGLNFGDPAEVRTVAESTHDKLSETLATMLKEYLAQNPSFVNSTDAKGWTALHQEAAAGSAATVAVLLEAGADPRAVSALGFTPLDLARRLGWDKVGALLERA